ncbi:hypothetical protein [Actinomadura keratinilytica]|uniref:hypothetical protein n=1 Tax=Actinomadura keratinilytica TaxID=547461 RepID=UPI003615675D
MRRSPVPVYVVLVPLVKGGTWEDPDQLLTVVHDRLGRDGAYLSLDDFQDQLAARQWGGTREQQQNTRYAAQVPFFLDEMKDAPLADRLIRAVDLIAAGRGKAEYEAATAHLGRTRSSTGSGKSDDGGGVPLPAVLGAAGLGAAAVAGLAVWRWRRTGRVPRRRGTGCRAPCWPPPCARTRRSCASRPPARSWRLANCWTGPTSTPRPRASGPC